MKNIPINVLVVDDDESFAYMLADAIKEKGHQVDLALGGEEGLDKFLKGAYDLVITDLVMPRLGGMELLKEIKKKDPRTVVLVITGFGTIDSATQAIKYGAYDFITKPFKLSEIEVVLERAIEKKYLSSQLGFFKVLALAAVISIPIWLLLGFLMAAIWN